MSPDRADLHLHTTASDGQYTPAQVVEVAERSGLAAIAITDHDTTAGYEPARIAASTIEIIPAVEVTSRFDTRELHLLGYFVRPEHPGLNAALEGLRQRRVTRFLEMVERFQGLGLSIADDRVRAVCAAGPPGRRQLAELLVEAGHAATVRQVFDRWLGDGGQVAAPSVGLPVAEAIAVVRGAGGVAIWAHPSYDGCRKNVVELQGLGLQGLEVDHPGCPPNRTRHLRQFAAELGLVVSAGSDCHGPEPRWQTIGARTTKLAELERIRELTH